MNDIVLKKEDKIENAKSIKDGTIIQLVTFTLEKEIFGIEILRVQEINKNLEITNLPNSPAYIEGVINLRGKVIPIINLRMKMGMPSKEFDNQTSIIVIDLGGNIVGFIVDSVKEVIRLSSSIIEQPPTIVLQQNSQLISSVAKLENGLLILLDADNLLSESEKEEINEIG